MQSLAPSPHTRATAAPDPGQAPRREQSSSAGRARSSRPGLRGTAGKRSPPPPSSGGPSAGRGERRPLKGGRAGGGRPGGPGEPSEGPRGTGMRSLRSGWSGARQAPLLTGAARWRKKEEVGRTQGLMGILVGWRSLRRLAEISRDPSSQSEKRGNRFSLL